MLKVSKIDNQLIVSIPLDLAKKLGIKEGSFIRMYESKPGVISIEVSKEKELPKLAEQEMSILAKLLSFKFEQRIPDNVNRQLTAVEKKALGDLLVKGLVNVYKAAKYPKGVYNIPSYVYGQYLEQAKPQPKQAAATGIGEAKKAKEEAKEQIREITPLERLEKFGFIVAEGEMDAKRLSDELASHVRKREIIGVRGFDKKYYIVRHSLVMRYAPKIKGILKQGSKQADKIAEEIGLDRQGTAALLTIMNDEGELIEKRKGTFALAD